MEQNQIYNNQKTQFRLINRYYIISNMYVCVFEFNQKITQEINKSRHKNQIDFSSIGS